MYSCKDFIHDTLPDDWGYTKNHAERQKKKQVEQIEDGMEQLKAKLLKTQNQLEEEREMEHKRRKQEEEDAYHREEKLKRDFERWKDEERLKFQQEMDKMRQLLLTHESKFQDLETYKSKASILSTLGTHADEEERLARQMMQQELRRLREEKDQLQTDSKIKLKEAKREHNAEKEELLHENERLRASMSNDQQTSNQQVERQIQALRSQIKDQSKLLKSQERTIKRLTASKEVPEIRQEVIAVGSSKPEDSSEEEFDVSLEQNLKRIRDLRMNSEFIQRFRRIIEDTLVEKLESIGVKKGTKGIPSSTLNSLKTLLATQLDQKVREYPEIHTLKAKLSKEVTRKAKQHRKNEDTFQYSSSLLSAQSLRSPRSIPLSDQLTQRARNVKIVESHQTAPKAPVPSPRTKVMGSQSTLTTTNVAPPPPPRTPPFTSEEDSSFPKPANKASPKEKSKIQEPTAGEDSDDWSDSDFSIEKPSPRSVTFSTGNTTQGSIVQSMTRSLEKQLSGPRYKPTGGVDVFSTQQSNKSSNRPKAAEKLQLSDESDSEISSLEEITENPHISESKPQATVRRSAESVGSQGTSLWSSGSKAGGW